MSLNSLEVRCYYSIQLTVEVQDLITDVHEYSWVSFLGYIFSGVTLLYSII